MRQPLPIHDGTQKYPQMVGKNLAGATDYRGEALVDCYVIGNDIYSRPYLKEFCDLEPTSDAPVDGLYYHRPGGFMVAVSNSQGYKVLPVNGNKTLLTATGGGAGEALTPTSQTGEKEIFIFDGYSIYTLYGAGGGKCFKFECNLSDSIYDSLTDADAPTDVSNPVVMDKYLIINDLGTGNLYLSDVGDPTSFSGNYFESEYKPDTVITQASKRGYLYTFGRNSIEVFYDDGATPFSRLTQGIVEDGVEAGRSLAWCNLIQTFVFLNNQYKLVKINGTQTVPISESLNRRLQWLVSNYPGYAYQSKGFYFEWDSRPYYFLNFSIKDSICVDLISGNWFQWLSSSAVTFDSNYGAFRGRVFAQGPYGLFVGDSTSTSKIFKLKSSEDQTELPRDDTSGYVRPLVRTGHVDRGDSGVSKICKSLTFNFNRLSVDSGSHADYTCTIYIRYRDNGKTTWSTEKTITVVGSGENPQQLTKTVYNLGIYKTRQWEFHIVSPAYSFSIPIEDFDYVY